MSTKTLREAAELLANKAYIQFPVEAAEAWDAPDPVQTFDPEYVRALIQAVYREEKLSPETVLAAFRVSVSEKK